MTAPTTQEKCRACEDTGLTWQCQACNGTGRLPASEAKTICEHGWLEPNPTGVQCPDCTPSASSDRSDGERVSEDDLAALIEWCEPRPNVAQGVKQPRNSWKNLTSALRELQRLRASRSDVSIAQTEMPPDEKQVLYGNLRALQRRDDEARSDVSGDVMEVIAGLRKARESAWACRWREETAAIDRAIAALSSSRRDTKEGERHSVTINQYQLLRAVEMCGGIFTGSDLTIEWFDAHECEEDGEKVTRPAGYYLYWTEYPEEGSTPLDAGPLTETFECIVCHVCGNERTIANGATGTDPRGYSDCPNCAPHGHAATLEAMATDRAPERGEDKS